MLQHYGTYVSVAVADEACKLAVVVEQCQDQLEQVVTKKCIHPCKFAEHWNIPELK